MTEREYKVLHIELLSLAMSATVILTLFAQVK